MKMDGKPVFVTGACGFIGSHLAEALVQAGARTRALAFYDARGSLGWLDSIPAEVRSSMEIISGDVRDVEQMYSLVREGETVFHLAALIGIPYSYKAPRSYVETNVTGTLNILEAARRNNAQRVLVTSTSEVYGTALRVPIGEDHPLQAQSPYSASKIAADKLAESFIRSFDLPATIVRPFNTFGPRQSPRAVIPTILMQAMAGGGKIKLGDATTTRDFNYVADTVEGFIRLASCDAARGQTVNIGTGVEISVADLAGIAGRICGKTLEIEVDSGRIRPSASEVRRLCADASLLRSLTGWCPPSRLEEGLRLTMEWMKQEGMRHDPDKYYV